MRATRIRGLAVGVAALMAFTTAACSSSGGTTGSSSDASGSTASAAKGAAIKVGLICSCSGAFGSTAAPKEKVYKAWVKSVNAKGGINGHPIDLNSIDDQSNPGNSVTAAQKLISNKVVAIVDLTTVDDPWAKLVETAKIPVVGVNLFNTTFERNPYFFPEGQTLGSISYGQVAAAKAAGAKNFAVFYCAEAPSCQETVPPLEANGKKLGVPMAYTTQVSATAPNYAAQCVAAKQKNIDAIVISHVTPVIKKIAESCNQQGYKPIYITQGASVAPLLLDTDGFKDNSYAPYSNMPYFADIAPYKEMNAAVDKYYPGLRQDVNKWINQSALPWPSGVLLEHALKAGGLTPTGTPTAAMVLKGLYSLKGDTLDGMAPPLTYIEGQPHPVNCWFTGRVNDGKPELVNDGKLSCEK